MHVRTVTSHTVLVLVLKRQNPMGNTLSPNDSQSTRKTVDQTKQIGQITLLSNKVTHNLVGLSVQRSA